METVTRVRFVDTGEVDRGGKPALSEVRDVFTALGFAPKVKGEINDVEQTLSTDGGELYFETGNIDSVEPDDRFIVRGEEFRVDSNTMDWRDAFSDWHPGLVVVLKRAEFVNGT